MKIQHQKFPQAAIEYRLKYCLKIYASENNQTLLDYIVFGNYCLPIRACLQITLQFYCSKLSLENLLFFQIKKGEINIISQNNLTFSEFNN
jgi:hypothetical protein